LLAAAGAGHGGVEGGFGLLRVLRRGGTLVSRGSTKDKDLQDYMPADGGARRRSTSGLQLTPLAAHRNVTRLGSPRKHTFGAAEIFNVLICLW
jgi:hypothetical protein